MTALFSGNLESPNGVVLVTMAGGSGTRFWPLSRKEKPKQFLPLGASGKSLIEESIERLLPIVGENGSLVVTAGSQASLVSEAVPYTSVLSEPLARNTAACLALAAHFVIKRLGDVVMICTPADHLVKGDDELRAVFKRSIALAKTEDLLITIGIKPTSPETGYGYIKRGQPFRSKAGAATGAFSVQQFVEKPDRSTATNYVESGDFYWNSGMFVWRPSVLLSTIEALLPETYRITKEFVSLMESNPDLEQLTALYQQLDSISIDFGVMEEADNVIVFPGHNFQWSDVGSWSSWYDSALQDSRDGFHNVIRGNVVLVGSEGCAVLSAGEMAENSISSHRKKLIAAVGLEDIIIVDTEDCLLVCKKDEAQRVREVVDILKERKLDGLI